MIFNNTCIINTYTHIYSLVKDKISNTNKFLPHREEREKVTLYLVSPAFKASILQTLLFST